jgi:hypothetical protein
MKEVLLQFSFYIKNATTLFTAIKIYPEIIKVAVSINLAPSTDKISRRHSSDGAIVGLQAQQRVKSEMDKNDVSLPSTDSVALAAMMWRKNLKKAKKTLLQIIYTSLRHLS